MKKIYESEGVKILQSKDKKTIHYRLPMGMTSEMFREWQLRNKKHLPK